MPAPGTHGYQADRSAGGSRKKKKKPLGSAVGSVGQQTGSSSSSSSSSSTSTSSPYYYPPSSATPPPSYSQPKKPKKKKKPKEPKINYIDSTLENGISALLTSLKDGKQRQSFAPAIERKPTKPEIPSLFMPLSERDPNDLQPIPEEDQKFSALQRLLQQTGEDPKAPKGSVLGGDPKSPFIDVWVPEAWKHIGRDPDAPLKEHFDADFIKNDILRGAMFPSQVEQNLTEFLKQQYWTRSKFLKSKIWGQYRNAKDTLDEAQKAAYEEGDFSVITEALEENPNLFDIPRYQEHFGITPKMIWQQTIEAAEAEPDEYMRSAIYYRGRMLKKHYRYLRDDYRNARKRLADSKEYFEDEYEESVEYHDAKDAPAAFPDLTPPTSESDQSMMDRAGRFADPDKHGDQSVQGLTDLIGIDVGTADDRLDRKFAKEDREARQQIRGRIKEQLGVDKLPSVRQMLAIKVAEGNLDPDNPEEIREWIERFQNPMHVDTRVMYMGFAMEENPDITEEMAEEFVNAPFMRWAKHEAREEKKAQEAEREEEESAEGFNIGFEGYELFGDRDPILDVTVKEGGGVDFDTSEGMLWTIDKLSRPLYSVASAVDAWYGMDRDDPKKARDWTDALAFIPGPQMAPSIASYLLTGKSWTDSLDELVSDPSSITNVLDAAGDQFNRNQDGRKGDEIVPMTFSQVIANQALRDPEDNLYDKDYFQHISGFLLDVAVDPLNLIGVGLIDDTLKLPTRMVKRLATESGLDVTTATNVMKRIYQRRQGSVFNVAEEMRQYIDSAPTSHPLISDNKLYGDWLAQNAMKERSLNQQIDQLNAQIKVTTEEAGLTQLRQQLDSIREQMDLNVGTGFNLQINRVLSRNSIPIEGTTYRNMGGRIWRDFIQDLELKAGKAGFSETKYLKEPKSESLTFKAQAAKDAQAKLDAYQAIKRHSDIQLDQAFPGLGAKAEPNNIEALLLRTIEDAKVTDDIRGRPHQWQEAQVERYLDDLEARGIEYKGAGGFDPVGMFAEAAGVSKAKFLKATKATPRDIYNAIIRGPGMLLDDPVMAGQMRLANSRIADSRQTLAALEGKTGPEVITMKRDAYKALSYGYSMKSEMTIAGGMRYLDELVKLRNQARGGWVNKPLAQHIGRLLQRVNKELKNYPSLDMEALVTRGDFIDSGTNTRIFEDYDFSDGASLSEILNEASNAGAFKGRTETLLALKSELTKQLKDLRLSHSVEVEGFTPAQAHQMDQILPQESQFRNPDGSINEQLIRETLTEPTPDDYEVWSVGYKIKNEATDPEIRAREFEYFAIIRDTAASEFRGAYRGEKSKILYGDANVLDEAEDLGLPQPTGTVEGDAQRFTGAMKGSTANPQFAKGVPDTTVRIRKKSPTAKTDKKTHEVFGPRTAAMRNRPTADDFRERSPEYTKAQMQKGKIKETHEFEYEKGKFATFDKVVEKDTPVGLISKTYTKKTKKQENWEQSLKQQQATWDRQYADARAADIMLKDEYDPMHKLTAKQSEKASKSAWNKTVDGIIDSLKTGEIPWSPKNARLSIDGEINAARRQAKLETEYKKTQVRIKTLQENNPNIQQMRAEIKALEQQHNLVQQELTKTREQAIATVREARKRADEDAMLQFINSLPNLTGRMVQLRIMGMRKNLQFTNSLAVGATQSAKFLPAVIMGNHANFFVRPTRQLTEKESIHIRAMWESMTPVVIQAHLTRLSDNMRKLTTSERHAMLRAYRQNRPYEGTHSDLYDGVVHELEEVEDILNGSHDFYFHKNSDGRSTPLSLPELMRFLPEEYQFSLNDINQWRYNRQRVNGPTSRKRKSKATQATDPFGPKPKGSAGYVLDDLMEAIIRGGHMPKDMGDPFRLAWVIRMAADQAQQLKSVYHSIETTFGVRIPPKGDPRVNMARGLIQKHGWRTHKELDPNVIFPPQIHNDIEKLLEFTKPGKTQTKLMRLLDTTIGYWKQGMTIYNPGYYTRNGVGEIMSSFLDGVHSPKWYRYAQEVVKFERGADTDLSELLKKWKVQEGTVPLDNVGGNKVLFKLKGGHRVTIEQVLQWYVQTGMKSTFANTDLDRGLRGLSGASLKDSKIKKAYTWQNTKVHHAGEGFEDWLRLAHFMHAMEDSGKGTLKAAAEHAAERVTKYHFDYTDFSEFEKMFMLRAFPFYKWIRRGAPLMLAHLFMTPGKMTAIPKAMDMFSNLGMDPLNAVPGGDPLFSTQDVHEDANGFLPNYDHIAPAWVRDLFAYQMQPSEDDEYANYFRMQTPQIDGLNAIFSLTPNEDSGAGWFGNSAGYPLLNPLLKAGIEGPQNQGMDPDFPYPIVGGEYNEAHGINPLEAITMYAGRQLNPWTSFFSKLSKNNDLPGPLGFGDMDTDRDPTRDWASQLTGVGFYQAWPGEKEVEGKSSFIKKLLEMAAVGPYSSEEIKNVSGAFAALKSPLKNTKSIIPPTDGVTGTQPYSAEGGSGWVDYPDFKWKDFDNWNNNWKNYGSSHYSGYSSSSSYSSGASGGSGTEFWDLIQKLRKAIDQGEVVDDA